MPIDLLPFKLRDTQDVVWLNPTKVITITEDNDGALVQLQECKDLVKLDLTGLQVSKLLTSKGHRTPIQAEITRLSENNSERSTAPTEFQRKMPLKRCNLVYSNKSLRTNSINQIITQLANHANA